jgi:septal ring factor EnvC (AmiA/AmiB activator)
MKSEKDSFPTYDQTDLFGFEQLWNQSHLDTNKFIHIKKSDKSTDTEHLAFLEKELEQRDFEIQKLEWQVNEREQELKNIYSELNKLLELNKKLNKQLEDYEVLESKYLEIIQKLASGSEKASSYPQLKLVKS